jgi:dedicator of cytokinesis protein 3
VRETNISTPSPTWHRASPALETSPVKQQADGATYVTGAGVVEEASAVQPISFKQRGARLSFLGGRRKESRESNGENVYALGEGDSNTTPNNNPGHQRSVGKEPRRSFFRGPSYETTISANPLAHSQANAGNNTPDWYQSVARKSSELVGILEKNTESRLDDNTPKRGSVRKRLSMLKLGGSKKGRPNGAMEGVEE